MSCRTVAAVLCTDGGRTDLLFELRYNRIVRLNVRKSMEEKQR